MMRRLAFCFLPVCVLALLAACAATPPPAAPAATGATCPVLDAGPPPTCPAGCSWDGKECRKDSGVIIYGERPMQPLPHPPPPPPPPPPR